MIINWEFVKQRTLWSYEDLIKKSPELMPNQPSDDAVRSNEESRKADRDSVESEPNRVHQN